MIGARRLLRLTIGRLDATERLTRAGAAVLAGAAVRRLSAGHGYRDLLRQPRSGQRLSRDPADRWHRGGTRTPARCHGAASCRCRRTSRYDGTGWAASSAASATGRSGNRNVARRLQPLGITRALARSRC